MSYPVTDVIQLAPTTTAAGSYAADLSKLSVDWANDDWIYLAIACSATSQTLSHDGTTGWSEVVELDVTSGVRMAVYKAKITGGTIGNPTINLLSGTGLWSGFAWIERDADATDPTPTNHYGTADGGLASSFSSATLTPGAGSPVDNCRIVYFAAIRGSNDYYLRMLDAGVVGDSLLNITDGSVSMSAMVASTSQTTAAATAKTIYTTTAAVRAGCITLAIKPGAGGKRAKQATIGIERLAWLGSFGAAHDGTLTPVTSSWGNPNSRTISGIAVSTTGATRITTATTGSNEWGTYDSNSCTLTSAAWQGNMLTFSADVDMTGKMFALEWNSGAFSSQVGDKGLIIVFEDNGGTNWAAFQLSQKTGFQWQNEYGSIIDLENATPYDSGGTLDWTLVRKVTPLLHRSGGTGARAFTLKNMLLVGKTTLMGGNNDTPLTINYLRQALHGMGYMGLVGGQSPAVTLRSDVQIGDTGDTTTYYDATGTLHAFPEAYDALTQREVNIPANKIDLTVDAGPNDTINFTATAISATLEQNLTFASGTDAGAEYSLQGAAIIGVLPTGQTAVPQVGATYSDCDTVAFGGADATNVTITDTTSTNAAVSWDVSGATADSCTIDGTGADYAIELGTSVTAIMLTDCDITAGSTDKVHVLATTGTVTITISGTTSLSAGDVTSAGATVDIAAPELYQKVTVSGITTGARVQIYDTTSATELFNGTASAGDTVVSGSTATWTDPLAASANRAIRVRVSYVSGVTADMFKEFTGLTCGQTSGTESVTYPVTPEDDTVYNANGENGSTVYSGGEITFTDAAQDLVEMDIAAGSFSLQKMYAAWVYWVFTSSGIASDIDYINAIDTANYAFTGIKWKNTSSPTSPLKITGGYAWDSTTGDPMDLIDTTGGTIFLAPAHVVAYATGSGVTAQDITDIAAEVLTAAASTPIHADVRKVNSYTVDGDGQSGTEWGPA